MSKQHIQNSRILKEHPCKFPDFRSEVALLLICDLIRSSGSFDWTASSPRLLHSAVLSLDSLRPALCKHARQVGGDF